MWTYVIPVNHHTENKISCLNVFTNPIYIMGPLPSRLFSFHTHADSDSVFLSLFVCKIKANYFHERKRLRLYAKVNFSKSELSVLYVCLCACLCVCLCVLFIMFVSSPKRPHVSRSVGHRDRRLPCFDRKAVQLQQHVRCQQPLLQLLRYLCGRRR